MTRTELLSRLDEITNRAPGSTRPDEKLREMSAWDSLAMMGFIALADGDLGVRLTGKQLADCQTIDDLIGLVKEKVTE